MLTFRLFLRISKKKAHKILGSNDKVIRIYAKNKENNYNINRHKDTIKVQLLKHYWLFWKEAYTRRLFDGLSQGRWRTCTPYGLPSVANVSRCSQELKRTISMLREMQLYVRIMLKIYKPYLYNWVCFSETRKINYETKSRSV